jgi:post-segregation antitoxin (ccd killing protein)
LPGGRLAPDLPRGAARRLGEKNVTVPLWLNVLAEKAGLNFSQILQAGLKSSLGIQDR